MSINVPRRNTRSPEEGNGAETIDIHRRALKLNGTVYDINRVMQACRARLLVLETTDLAPGEKFTVYVRSPQNDEP